MLSMLLSARPEPQLRNAYLAFCEISTRWSDNDIYGHVNNVVYYSWFDTAVNSLLIQRGALDIQRADTAGGVIGLVVETHCNYFSSLSFPEKVVAGVRVARIGSSSVRYEIGLFSADATAPCAACGHFVHVYVDRATRRPAVLPPALISVLETLL